MTKMDSISREKLIIHICEKIIDSIKSDDVDMEVISSIYIKLLLKIIGSDLNE